MACAACFVPLCRKRRGSLCRSRYRKIFHRNALTGIGDEGFFRAIFRKREGINETVMDHDALSPSDPSSLDKRQYNAVMP